MAAVNATTAGGSGGGRWMIRLANVKVADEVTSVDEMRQLAVKNRLGLCNFTYGPVNMTSSNGSYVEHGWAVDDDGCVQLLVVDSRDEVIIVHGYISPIIVLLTLITNSLVSAVLLQRHMRTPTNVFLLALAVSDALTGAVPLPVFMHLYTAGAYREMLVPPSWCHLYLPIILHLPTMWHTASIWLTVGLAFQRYVYICHQAVAKRLCTVRNAVIAVLAVYVAAIMSQSLRIFEHRYEPISDSVSLGAVGDDDSAAEHINITGCYAVPLLAHQKDLYFSTYW